MTETKTKECKHGTFTYYPTDHWIGGALDRFGEYSEGEVQKLVSLVGPDATVIEVGGNIGAITIPLGKHLTSGKLYVFEPQPDNASLLELNISQNGLAGPVQMERLIVSDEPGVGAMPLINFENTVNSGAASVVPMRESGTVEVQKVTVDMWFNTDAPRLDLLKVDVEGHELHVLRGARKTIAKYQPIIYVENDRPELSVELITMMMDMGYVCFWHLPELKNPAPEKDGTPYVSVNMLCFHKDKLFDAALISDCRKIMSAHDDWNLALLRMMEAKLPEAPAILRGKQWACITRLGGVGDNLMASSVLPYLKQKFGHLEVITSDPQSVVFENNPYIDKLTVKGQGDPNWGNGQDWQDYWASRAKEYAFFANLSHSCETLRAAVKAQTMYYWPASTRRKFLGYSYLETVADVCEVPYDKLRPQFFPTDLEWEHARETKRLVGGKYIAWVISGTRVDKIWPNAGVCIARIIKDLGIPVLMIGAPGRDFELAKMIEEHVRLTNGTLRGLHTCISVDPLRPNWPIRRVLSQTLAADLVIAPDTGPAWAVAYEDMPKIVMLSHASKENITKHWRNTVSLHADPSRVPCWPCHLLIDAPADCERLSGRSGGVGAACISDISVDDVMREVRRALQPAE